MGLSLSTSRDCTKSGELRESLVAAVNPCDLIGLRLQRTLSATSG